MQSTVNRRRRLLGAAALLTAAAGWGAVRLSCAADVGENALSEDGLPFYTDADLLPRWKRAGTRRIGRFSLRNQFGQRIDEGLLERGATVLSFFFTGCATQCPVALELLDLARQDMGREAPSFLSISVTPRLDDERALRVFAERARLPSTWQLATGDAEQVYRLARRELLTDIESPGADNLPPHTERALLIDAERRIRGIYNATLATELQRLKADVRRLRPHV